MFHLVSSCFIFIIIFIICFTIVIIFITIVIIFSSLVGPRLLPTTSRMTSRWTRSRWSCATCRTTTFVLLPSPQNHNRRPCSPCGKHIDTTLSVIKNGRNHLGLWPTALIAPARQDDDDLSNHAFLVLSNMGSVAGAKLCAGVARYLAALLVPDADTTSAAGALRREVRDPHNMDYIPTRWP